MPCKLTLIQTTEWTIRYCWVYRAFDSALVNFENAAVHMQMVKDYTLNPFFLVLSSFYRISLRIREAHVTNHQKHSL